MGAWAYKIVPKRIDVRGGPHLLRVSLLATACAVALAPACRQPNAPAVRRTVRLTTGTPGAAFYPLSQALARAWAEAFPALDVKSRDSAGSVANVEAIQSGDADIGLAYADVAYMAYVAQLGKPAPAADILRGIAVLELAPVHLVVGATRPSGARPICEAAGSPSAPRQRVGPDRAHRARGARHRTTADVRVESLRYLEAGNRLAAGTLDAMFVTGSDPMGRSATLDRGRGPAACR